MHGGFHSRVDFLVRISKYEEMHCQLSPSMQYIECMEGGGKDRLLSLSKVIN